MATRGGRKMSGDLQAQFLQAKDDVVNLSKAPDNEVKLQLYALFKQATEGDYTNGKKPGMMDFVGKVKYEAWKKQGKMGWVEASQRANLGRYVPFVIGGVAGTIADVAYGYTVACVKEVEAHRAQREEKLRNITGQS